MIITYPGSLLLMTAYPMTVQYVGFMFEGSVKGFVTLVSLVSSSCARIRIPYYTQCHRRGFHKHEGNKSQV